MAIRVVMVLAVFAALCGCDPAGPTPEEQAKNAGRSEPAPGLSTRPPPDPGPAPVVPGESVSAPAPVVPAESGFAPPPAPAEPGPAPEPVPTLDPGRCPPTPPYPSDCGEE